MKILLGIPAYNEEGMIGVVLKSLPRKLGGFKVDYLMVDDGSSDDTVNIAQKFEIKIIRHLINRGLGGALKTIFAYARNHNYNILITFDADGQHDPYDLDKLIKPIIDKKSDVVIGSRWKKKSNVPFSRVFINKIANIITFLMYGILSSDSQSGLRVFGDKAIRKITLKNDGMEVSSEIFKEINRNKLTFSEVPVKALYTKYSISKGQKLSNGPNIAVQLFLRLIS